MIFAFAFAGSLTGSLVGWLVFFRARGRTAVPARPGTTSSAPIIQLTQSHTPDPADIHQADYERRQLDRQQIDAKRRLRMQRLADKPRPVGL